MKGTVKWFNNAKATGSSDARKDHPMFLCTSALSQPKGTKVCKGDSVDFEIAKGPKGEQAANVKKAG
jgi:CspA family cold shock protein